MKANAKRVQIVLASRNEGKLRELTRLLDEPRIVLACMKDFVAPDFDVEESGCSFEENAWLKALEICWRTGLPTISDDSGLEVDALGGRPGVYSARYAGPEASDADNNRLLMEELSGTELAERTARFRCALAFAAPTVDGEAERVACVHGVLEGRILRGERGAHGFGYDPLFEARQFPGRSTAEITPEEKNRISHRGEAALLLQPILRSWLEHQILS